MLFNNHVTQAFKYNVVSLPFLWLCWLVSLIVFKVLPFILKPNKHKTKSLSWLCELFPSALLVSLYVCWPIEVFYNFCFHLLSRLRAGNVIFNYRDRSDMPQKIEGNTNFFVLVKFLVFFFFFHLGKNEIAVLSAVSKEFEEPIPLISLCLVKWVIKRRETVFYGLWID